ncbi:MAG: glycine cleavage system aminomethyltransferase GcvT, partial [Comamonadaceae bacterium]
LCLYGADIDTTTTPVEAALTWAIQKVRRPGGARAGGFPGAERVLAQLAVAADAAAGRADHATLTRRRVGLVALERIPVRDGTPLESFEGHPIGQVTSGLLGPSVDRPIAMGYVATAFSTPGTRLQAIVRGKPVPMEVTTMPFVPTRYFRG